ncbi:MAG: thiol:disulfide interchange protein [Brevundimonas sp.]|nr:MAG: thiol:disulfide interchange protein [Brevundimonas sp.]
MLLRILALWLLAMPGAAWAQADRLQAELVPMSQWAAPGSTAVVAVRQRIAPGWHTYWKNPGDSGMATALTWNVPAGQIVWPLPSRQRVQGFVNYGYEGEVFLPVPIEVPASARGRLPLRVTALFTVCSAEVCVPDERELSLDLPIREGAPPPAEHGAAIARVLAQAPSPAGIEARVGLTDGVLTLTAIGGPLAGRDPGPSYFFADTSGVIDHAAAQSGSWGPQGLTLVLTGGARTRTGGLTGPISGVLQTASGVYEITARPGAPLAGATGSGDLAPVADAAPVAAPAPTTAATFVQAALFALLGGLILNLMPCVFPVLAMKAAALASSAHDPRHARRDGLSFLAGVLTTFLILAGVLLALRAAGEAVGWGFQLQSPPVTAGLALLMLAVALNLSGVFEVGGRLQAFGGGRLSRLSGGAGAFFTGVLAVVVAAPCTAPFMAFALGAALVMPWAPALLVFLMLGLGLALPFVVVSLSPALLARLPRPGPWMARLKGLLAFPMYGAALWLAWVFSRQTGADALGLLFGGGLLLALGLWLIGLWQGQRTVGRPGRLHLAGGVLALALAATLLVTAVRAPVEPVSTPGEGVAIEGRPWSAEAVADARAEGRPVLVNFTADWCVTCKINEGAALSSPKVRAALDRSGAVYLVGDWTRRDDAITAELRRHGRSGVPLYLLYPPGGGAPKVLPQLLSEGAVVETLLSPDTIRLQEPAGR